MELSLLELEDSTELSTTLSKEGLLFSLRKEAWASIAAIYILSES